MKRFSVLSLVVGIAMIFSLGGFGCKKAEQQAEAPQSTQPATTVAVEEFKVTGGTLEKGGIGAVLSSAKDKMGVAVNKNATSYKNIVTIKGQMKAGVPSGIKNGFIIFGDNPTQLARAGVFIGSKMLAISGPFVEKAEKKENFDQSKVFDFELAINLKEKTVNWKVDGLELKSKITKVPASIKYIGYSAWSTTTEFSELRISGD